MKTLKGWANGTFDHYVHIGDEIDDALYYHMMSVVPPKLHGRRGFMMGEPMTEHEFMVFGRNGDTGRTIYRYHGYMTVKQFMEGELW